MGLTAGGRGTLLCAGRAWSVGAKPPGARGNTPSLPFTHGTIANGATKSAVCSAPATAPKWQQRESRTGRDWAGQSGRLQSPSSCGLFRSGLRAKPRLMQPTRRPPFSDQDIKRSRRACCSYLRGGPRQPTGLEARPFVTGRWSGALCGAAEPALREGAGVHRVVTGRWDAAISAAPDNPAPAAPQQSVLRGEGS